jgi:hypothetical protein
MNPNTGTKITVNGFGTLGGFIQVNVGPVK